MKINEILTLSPVIPVMEIEDLNDAVPLAQALVEGGLKVLEITLRTPVALDAIKAIKSSVSGAIVGSGTVINQHTFQASLNANVDFMVSPGMSSNLLEAVLAENVKMLPGVATPSEAMNLLDAGFNCLKFFPAEASGGANLLKSIAGPLPQITFCPTGGISMSNAKNYLSLPNVACVGGSWMLDKQLIKDKNWQQITLLCQQICSELKSDV
jgi:2-dehydro-3-deoxyphosphogluconate aldolase/(4S)-4-hydroxy-2-oxoglutarate aldolase